MRRLQVKLLRDLGNAVVVQAIDRVEVFSKNASLYELLRRFMASEGEAEACES